MHQRLQYLILFLVIALAPLANLPDVVAVAKPALGADFTKAGSVRLPGLSVQGTQIYNENFTTFNASGKNNRTKWDIWNHHLELDRLDAPAQLNPDIVAINKGESLVVWEDGRNGDSDIYAQRIDENGNRLWQSDLRVNTDGSAAWQNSARITADGSGQFVIVWRDGRNNREDIYAQRLDINGTHLWPSDLQVNANVSISSKEAPCISANNSGQILVAWQDDRNFDIDIYAQRIGPDGDRLWPDDVRINSDVGTEYQQQPAIATDSSGQFVIAWHDRRNNGDADIYAQRIDANANRAWASDVRVNSDVGSNWQSAVAITASGNGQFMLVWQDSRNQDSFVDVYAQMINASGAQLWPADIRVNSNTSDTWKGLPAITSDGSGQAEVVWVDARTGTYQVYMQHIAQNGTRIFPEDIHVSSLIETLEQMSPAIAINDNGIFTVLWIGGDSNLNLDLDLFAQSFQPSGVRIWPSDQRVNAGKGAATQVTPAIASDSSGKTILIWKDMRDGSCAIYAQRIDPSGNRLWNADLRITHTALCQSVNDSAITTDDNGNFLIVWGDLRETGCGIYGQLIDIFGNRLWPNDLALAISPNSCASNPTAASLSTGQFIVAYEGLENGWMECIAAQRVDVNGNLYWQQGLRVNSRALPGRYYSPAVAVDSDGNAIIVWQDQRNEGNGPFDIYAQRLDANGNRTWLNDVRINSDSIGHSQENPQIINMGSDQLLVVWQDGRGSSYDIYAQLLDGNGSLMWANDVRVNTDTGYYTYQGTPVVISTSNGQALVSWLDNRNTELQIFAQRLDSIGNRIWPIEQQVTQDSRFTGSDSFMAATRDQNGDAIIAWQDTRFGNGDIFIQKMRTTGNPGWSSDIQIVNPDSFYFSSGSAQSRTVANVSGNIRSASLIGNIQENSGSVKFYLSNNDGVNWEGVTPGINHIFDSTGSKLRWKVELSTDPAWSRSPVISNLQISYSTEEVGADDYEPDDACSQARPIALNGAVQQHNFHQANDADWVWLDVVQGKTYIIQTSQTEANADTSFSSYRDCSQAAFGSSESPYEHGSRFTFLATYTGRVYIEVRNQTPPSTNEFTGYAISARLASSPPVVVIVAGHDDVRSLQTNINYSADLAYRTFVNSGIPKANIRYFGLNSDRDVDGNGLNDDIAGPPEPMAVRTAIQDWSRIRGVSLGVPFFLYMVDHGHYDQFLANGTAGKITASDLDLWLSNLEATSGADQVNVIIEACHSGSFIDQTSQGPSDISSHNRVVITSTTAGLNAYPSLQGAFFSDAFWTALSANIDLMTAFEHAKQAVQASGLSQQPWLDDNGDGLANSQDGALARNRGLSGAFGGSAPVIDWAKVTYNPQELSSTIQAQVRDDFGVDQVWVQIFEPGFIEPPPSTDGTLPVLNTPVVNLVLDGSQSFQQSYTFNKTGLYRLVFYAKDFDSNIATPLTVLVQIGKTIFVPIIKR